MGGAVSSITGGDFKSGAIAAGASQAMAGALNSTFNDQPNLRQAFSQIVGLTAAGLAGADINKASWVALMADEYNRQLHQKEVLALEKLQEENPEKAYQLKAAACAIVHCSASVHPDDQKNYDALTKLEADGSGFKDAQSALFATGAFDEYSKWDQVNDGLLRNEESAQRTGNAGRAIFGAAGAVAGYSGAILTSPACVTLVGCALPGMSAAAGAASFLESWEATGRLFAPYEYTQGDRVLASFSSETYPGDVNPLRDYGTEAAKAAVEMVLLKGAGKYLEGTGSSILVSGVKKEGVVADGVIGASNTDKPVLPAWYREDSSAGASFNKTDGLPDGYRRVLNTRTGNAEILAPDGQLYFDTGNGLKPKVGGNLAELAEAERLINGAKNGGASGFSGGKPTVVDDSYSPSAVTERSKVSRDDYGRENAANEFSAGLPNYTTHSTAKSNQSAAPRDLNEQTLWNRVIENPAAGRDTKLAGDKDFPRSEGWQKMEVSHRLPSGENITVHYQYNSVTGKAYDMKITTPQQLPPALQPGRTIE
jgi:filamentous hemagglutinin